MNSLQDWHLRYLQQARWTKNLREYLFQKANLKHARSVLDVGCGTGALFSDISALGSAEIYGLDINFPNLFFARETSQATNLSGGDAHDLPYPQNNFDIVLCHYLLLWVADPGRVIQEMQRVTRKGGFVIAVAEPDYGGRIDFPDELTEVGELQMQALIRQGAEPLIGRRLASLFSQSGFSAIETGILGAQWNLPLDEEEWEAEWRVLEDDVKSLISADRLETIRIIDASARKNGNRLLFIPTFYTWAKK